MRFRFLLLAWLAATSAWAGEMSVLRFVEREPGQAETGRRALILGERLRLDYGGDAEDYLLFDRAARMLWLVNHGEKRVTGIPAANLRAVAQRIAWPADWTWSLERQQSQENTLYQVRVNQRLCVEFKAAAQYRAEARMLRDYSRALAARRAAEWEAAPEAARDPCFLLLEVRQAGLEYEQGLPLAIRRGDGRQRLFQAGERAPARLELFETPAGYMRLMLAAE